MTERIRHFALIVVCLLVAVTATAQTTTLTGRVTDEQGEPLAGVFIVVQNVQKQDVAANRGGTLTDKDGRYRLTWTTIKEPRLQFTYIGMLPHYATWQGQRTLDVTMRDDSQQLDDVVVTGVQTIEKGRATGSFKILDQKAMKNIYSNNLVDKLEGTTPGLLVGADNQLTIRGLGSMRTTTQPLIVVDGYPLESSTLNINPADVEQITVLKDAASASIWGIRAANGVVVITTKRGKKGARPQVTYSTTLTLGAKPDLDDLHELSSEQYARLLFEDFDADQPYKRSLASGEYNDIEKVWLRYRDTKEITRDQAMAELAKIGAYSNRQEILDNFYRSPLTQQHTLSLSYGNERSTTYASLNFDQNKQNVRGNGLDKVNLLLNTDYRLTRNFRAKLNVRATQQWQQRDGNGSMFTSREPWQRILNDDGSYFDESVYSYSAEFMRRALTMGFKDFRSNPLEAMRMNDKRTKTYNLSTSLALEWEPLKGLKLSTTGTYETGRTEDVDYYSPDHEKVRSDFNYYTECELDEDNLPTALVKHYLPAEGGIKDFTNTNLTSYSWRSQISWEHDFHDFNVRAMAGNDIYSLEGNTYNNRLWGYNDKYQTNVTVDLNTLQNGVATATGGYGSYNSYTPSTSETLERYVSWFGTASASYKTLYNLFASVRLDQTNLLTNATKFRNNPSWSVGGKWNISEERFFPKTSWIDNLAVRLSYGMSGNINKTTSPDMTGRFLSGWHDMNVTVLQVSNPANPALGWEKNYTVNVGFDLSMLRHRLGLTLDVYNRECKDLLSSVVSDATVGWSSYLANAASMVNRGVELTLTGTPVKTRDWQWDCTLNFTYNKNKVTKCLPVSSPYYAAISTGYYFEGYPLNDIVTFRYGGLDDKGEATYLRADGTQCPWGDLKSLTEADLVHKGDSNPPFFGSFMTSLRWRQLTLSTMLTYRFGHYMRLPSPSEGIGNEYTKWIGEDCRWIEGNDNAGKWVPRLYTGNGGNSLVTNDYWRCLDFSDRMVESASVVRMKSVRLEYDLTHLLRKIHLTGGSVAVAGENLFYWAANRDGVDPETITSSLTQDCHYQFATPRRVVMSLNVTF